MESVEAQLEQWMEDPTASSDTTMLTVAAMTQNREGKHEEALKYVHNPTSLEM